MAFIFVDLSLLDRGWFQTFSFIKSGTFPSYKERSRFQERKRLSFSLLFQPNKGRVPAKRGRIYRTDDGRHIIDVPPEPKPLEEVPNRPPPEVLLLAGAPKGDGFDDPKPRR